MFLDDFMRVIQKESHINSTDNVIDIEMFRCVNISVNRREPWGMGKCCLLRVEGLHMSLWSSLWPKPSSGQWGHLKSQRYYSVFSCCAHMSIYRSLSTDNGINIDWPRVWFVLCSMSLSTGCEGVERCRCAAKPEDCSGCVNPCWSGQDAHKTNRQNEF